MDATAAFHLMRLISKLATLGHSIVMTLHQPTSRIFHLMCRCNHRLLILESGNLSYFGYARNATTFFESIGYKVPPLTNATDFFLDLVNRDFDDGSEYLMSIALESYEYAGVEDGARGTKTSKKDIQQPVTADIVNDAFREQQLPQLLEEVERINLIAANLPQPVLEGNTYFVQFLVLCKRNTINLMRNPGIFWLRLVMYVALCLCLGTLYWNIDNKTENTQDRVSLLYFCMTFFSFMSISAMPAFVEERGVYMRERTNNHYRTITYVLADFVATLPWMAMLSIVCSGIVYCMCHLRWGWEYFGVFVLAFFVTMMVSENIMIAISAASSYFMVGLALGAGLLGLYITLGGFVLRIPNIPDGWKWAHYTISFHAYAYEIFMDNDLKDNYNVDIGGTGSGNEVLKDFGMNDADIGFDFGVLCIMIAVYRIIFYILLKFKHRRLE